MIRRLPSPPLFPYTTLFRSGHREPLLKRPTNPWRAPEARYRRGRRSEEHTSELQSPDHLVCRLLLEKKKKPPSSLTSGASQVTRAARPVGRYNLASTMLTWP